MFDGGSVPEQFHQFIASKNSIPLPISFPHHHDGVASIVSSAPSASFASCFESYHHYPQGFCPPPDHHQQLQPSPAAMIKVEEVVKERRDGSVSDQSINDIHPLWTNDEVLALLRIRSSLENWFPDFTWEHVSRKLGEVGFQRRAEQCKEKFEEESRNFSNNMSYNKSSYRFFNDLDELNYHGEEDQDPQAQPEKTPNLESQNEKEEEEVAKPNSHQENDQEVENETIKSRKRKRERRENKFEMFKGFCEDIVKKIIAQQEELHNKLIQDMINRDEESIAREDAWKNQEIDRINKEIEKRAQEQAIEDDRQAKIIEFLKKFTQDFSHQDQNFLNKIQDLLKVISTTKSPQGQPSWFRDSRLCTISTTNCSNNIMIPHINPITSSSETTPSPPPITINIVPKNPNISSTTKVQENNVPLVSKPTSSSPNVSLQMDEKGDRDTGKRWPRDEVMALINLRCSLNNNNNNSSDDNKDVSSKGPLWERISKMMLELGYKRSAKRCKEKWENINKYFRKTKDNKKKRSMDSRTCPYFYQLSSLYSEGSTLVGPSDVPENR